MNKFGIGLNGSYFLIGPVDTLAVNDNSTVSEFALINKNTVLDNKYDSPKTFSLSGSISAHTGNLNAPFLNDELRVIEYENTPDAGLYLKKVFDFLSKLKKGGYVFKLFSPSNIFDNCILTDISWSIQGASINYTLSIKEIFIFALEQVKRQVAPYDKSLPTTTDLVQQSFTQKILLKDSKETDLVIIETLRKAKLMQDSFVAQTVTLGVIGLGAGLAIAWGVSSLAVLFASNPVGWVVGAIAAVGAGIYFLVKWIQEEVERANRRRIYLDEFVGYSNKEDQIKEVKRFSKVVSSIYKELERFSSAFKTYGFTLAENQVLNLSIGGMNVEMELRAANNNKNEWYFSLRDYDQNYLTYGEKVMKSIKVLPFVSIYQANNENAAFELNNEKIFFIYDILSNQDISVIDKNGKTSFLAQPKVDLLKVSVVVTSFDLTKFKKSIGDITLNAMKRKGVA